MSRRQKSPFLALEQQIASDERRSVLNRWRYGRELLAVRGSRKQLPKGLAADLIKAAARAALKLSEREIRYRLSLAEAYRTEAQVCTAVQSFESWTALREAGFPAVSVDEPDEVEALGLPIGVPDTFEQLSLTIPGLSETLSVHGQKIPLATATVADVRAYCETYQQIHENFGKRLARIEFALSVMTDGAEGDDSANAVEAWRRGCNAA